MSVSRPALVRSRRLGALLLLPLVLAACGGAGGEAGYAADCAAVRALGAGGSGRFETHAAPQRSESEVVLTREGNAWRASRSITLTNDFGGASLADVTLATANGSVSSCPIAGGGYGVVALLSARAATEQQAREALDAMALEHEDGVQRDSLSGHTRLTLSARVGPQRLPAPLPGLSIEDPTDEVERSASLIAGLPTGPSYALEQQSGNGAVQSAGFSGRSAALGTANGLVALDGRWDTTRLSTTNGFIAVAGDHAELDASTTNSGIGATLDTVRSVRARLSSTNGSIEVGLRRSAAAAYDLQASTTNGLAQISVAGTEAIGPQQEGQAHRQTPGYTAAAVQVAVDASLTNGDVHIHD